VRTDLFVWASTSDQGQVDGITNGGPSPLTAYARTAGCPSSWRQPRVRTQVRLGRRPDRGAHQYFWSQAARSEARLLLVVPRRLVPAKTGEVKTGCGCRLLPCLSLASAGQLSEALRTNMSSPRCSTIQPRDGVWRPQVGLLSGKEFVP
jgi:hypothetical protein